MTSGRPAWRSHWLLSRACQGDSRHRSGLQYGGGLPPPNGYVWIGGNPGSCMMWDAYNHFMPPNTFACDSTTDGNTEGYASLCDAFPPASNHPGGVNICFADGSVRFIKNSVGLQVWWAIGTRNGARSSVRIRIDRTKWCDRIRFSRDGSWPARRSRLLVPAAVTDSLIL